MAFVAITMSDIALFLTRAFRALDPKPGPVRYGELTYDLELSPKTFIRIYTSVHQGVEDAAGKGTDAIRVGLFGGANGRPLKSGKMPIVKRTNSWKDTLKETVEDLCLEYDSNREYWESRY
jgi:hypothetical protein